MNGTTTTTYLSEVVTADMVNGVFNETLALLPVMLHAAVLFIGIRKGIKFVLSILRSA